MALKARDFTKNWLFIQKAYKNLKFVNISNRKTHLPLYMAAQAYTHPWRQYYIKLNSNKYGTTQLTRKQASHKHKFYLWANEDRLCLIDHRIQCYGPIIDHIRLNI